jgi:hypothetical protein
MPITASDVRQLRDGYRGARAEILKLPGLEQEIGLAALRLQATHTYKELATTAQGLEDEDLAPLGSFVRELVGGEGVEKGIAWLDSEAQKMAKAVLTSISSSLVGGVAVGVGATVAGTVATIAGAAEEVGASLTTAVLGGGSAAVFVVRGVYYSGRAGHDATLKSLSWAQSVGTAAEHVLSKVSPLERSLWSAATGGAPGVFRPFTEKARLRAQLLVGAAVVLVGLGLILVAVGAVEAFSNWSSTPAIPESSKSTYGITIPGSTEP